MIQAHGTDTSALAAGITAMGSKKLAEKKEAARQALELEKEQRDKEEYTRRLNERREMAVRTAEEREAAIQAAKNVGRQERINQDTEAYKERLKAKTGATKKILKAKEGVEAQKTAQLQAKASKARADARKAQAKLGGKK